jgi:hypothetical protein
VLTGGGIFRAPCIIYKHFLAEFNPKSSVELSNLFLFHATDEIKLFHQNFYFDSLYAFNKKVKAKILATLNTGFIKLHYYTPPIGSIFYHRKPDEFYLIIYLICVSDSLGLNNTFFNNSLTPLIS